MDGQLHRDHPFSAYAKFSDKLKFICRGCAHVIVYIGGKKGWFISSP